MARNRGSGSFPPEKMNAKEEIAPNDEKVVRGGVPAGDTVTSV